MKSTQTELYKIIRSLILSFLLLKYSKNFQVILIIASIIFVSSLFKFSISINPLL